MDVSAKKTPRNTAIDEFRAIAILSMIIAHFAPGLFDRLPQLDWLRNYVMVAGRLATVAFVVVFGITIGYVYLKKFMEGDAESSINSIYRRARLVFLCVFIFAAPEYINLIVEGETNAYVYLRKTYSVLNFYALALFLLPSLLRLVKSSPWVLCPAIGVLLWLVGYGVLMLVVEPPKYSMGGYVYYLLAGGAFGVFQLLGVSLVFVPVGLFLKTKSREFNLRRLTIFVSVGLLLVVVGASIGNRVGEMTLEGFASGRIKIPPRVWYWCFFGGASVIIFSVLMYLHEVVPGFAKFMRPVALFGMSSLAIFTSHTWVLPLVNWFDRIYVVEGMSRAIFAMALFGLFCCASVLWKRPSN